MDDPFKSENYKKNLDSLIKAIKLGDVKEIEKQYKKTVRDLSQALEGFTDKAEDVAKFVICSDLNNYIEPVNKKPPGLFGTLKEIWNRILGKDVPIENEISNFAKGELFTLPTTIALEYLNVSKKILDGVNLANRTASKQEEDTFKQPKEKLSGNRMRQIKRPTTAPPPPPDLKKTSSSEKASLSVNELKPELQEKLTTTRNKKVRFESKVKTPLEDSGYESS
ncbi:hypothetical protein [Wolbachia endosymbiont of Cantharis cryptica]|uniref:hypothetical protein n=1 Tax=Wolbachia endosymbiont of Cantharis cryptica TaxID=3066132 RepID=UPI00376F11AA